MHPWTRPLVPARYQTAVFFALLLAIIVPIALAVRADARDHRCWAWNGTEAEYYGSNVSGCGD